MNDVSAVRLGIGELAVIRAILKAHLPQGARVTAFGSRASGHARRYSDLDLALDAGRPLSLNEFAALRDGFSESDLPFKVDLVDLCLATPAFRAIIERQAIPLAQERHDSTNPR